MSGDFQIEQKIVYVLATHPLFRQQIKARNPDSQKNTFLQNIPLVLVSVQEQKQEVAPLVFYKFLNLEMPFRHNFLLRNRR